MEKSNPKYLNTGQYPKSSRSIRSLMFGENDMEPLIDKLRKIKALAENGVAGEAKAARAQLERPLSKHGVTMEELAENTMKERRFRVTKSDTPLFYQTLASVIGNRYKSCYYYRGESKVTCVEMSDLEYLDFKQYYLFHRNQLNREIKKSIDLLVSAYYHKHKIFNCEQSANGNEDDRTTPEEIAALVRMMQNLEDVSYHKQLNR